MAQRSNLLQRVGGTRLATQATARVKTSMSSEDAHFFVVKGRRWPKSNPHISEKLCAERVKELMAARRVKKIELKCSISEDSVLFRRGVTRDHLGYARRVVGDNVVTGSRDHRTLDIAHSSGAITVDEFLLMLEKK